jgi:flavodoxin
MDAFEVTELPAARRAVFVTSTMGQGDPPSNARSFWKFLLRKSLPEDSLRRLSFACFGLGDSHYAKFNVAAKKLHRRLERLGATSVVALGLGDDQHPAGYDYALDPWLTGLWKVLRSDDEFSDEPRRNDSRQQTSDSVSDACRFAVFQETAASRFDEAVDAPPSVETLLDVAEKFDALTEAAAPIDRRWLKRGSATNGNDDSSRGSSSFGVAASVRALTSDTAVARTAHVEIALDDKSDDKSAHSSYDVGDCLEVMPFALCGGAASEATGYGKSADAFGDAEIDTTWCVGADFVLRRSGIDPRAFVRVAAADSSRTKLFRVGAGFGAEKLRGSRAPPRARVLWTSRRRLPVGTSTRPPRGSRRAPPRRNGFCTSPPPRAATTRASTARAREELCLSFWTISHPSPCRFLGCSRRRRD